MTVTMPPMNQPIRSLRRSSMAAGERLTRRGASPPPQTPQVPPRAQWRQELHVLHAWQASDPVHLAASREEASDGARRAVARIARRLIESPFSEDVNRTKWSGRAAVWSSRIRTYFVERCRRTTLNNMTAAAPTTPPTYSEKRKQWVACLSGDDRNSITRQIIPMIWNAAAFRVVNEARRLALTTDEGGVQLNGLMHGLINDCFFRSQLLAVRRLVDQGGLQGKRGTFSLRGLLDDMKVHLGLFTRQNICGAEDVPLDLEPVRRQYDEFVRAKVQSGECAWHVPQSLSWDSFERRHREIDALAGVDGSTRSGTDQLQVRVLDALLARLNECGEISIYVNKFIAHAATPESRAPYNVDDAGIALEKLWDAHEVLCRVTNTIEVFLLTGTSHGFLATPQYDLFRYIERPLVSAGGVKKLRKTWDAYDDETTTWQAWNVEDLLKAP